MRRYRLLSPPCYLALPLRASTITTSESPSILSFPNRDLLTLPIRRSNGFPKLYMQRMLN